MSRFIDKLNQVSSVAPPPIGFKAATQAARPKMALVASLAEPNTDGLTECVAGADAAVVSIKATSGISALKKMAEAAPSIPWGGWLGNVGEKDAGPLTKAGADFVVFPATASVALAAKSELGKVLQIDVSLDGSILRSVEELPVDAVLVGIEPKEGLNWHSLMLLQRLAGLTKPLVVLLPADVTAAELQALLDAGVEGVMVEVKTGEEKRIQELRRAIDSLALPSRRKRRKAEAVVPQVRLEPEPAEEEEEEEGE